MPENPYRAPDAPIEPPVEPLGEGDQSLGPAVFTCRRRSMKEAMFEMGFEFTYLRVVLGMAVVAFIGTGMLLGIIARLAGIPIGSTGAGILLALAFLIALAGVFWFSNREPRRSSLVLHQRGFRCKELLFRFDEIKSIVIGLSNPKPRRSEPRQAIDEATVTVTLKNGYSWKLPGLLLGIKADDANEFFDRIRARYPELITMIDNDPGVGDLKFRMSQVG